MPVTLHTGCAEDVLRTHLNPSSMDLILTSPPFFCAEKYEMCTSDSVSQSHIKFNTFPKWCACFLKPTIADCARILRPGGKLILHVSDVTRSSTTHEICKAVLVAAGQTGQLQYVGVWGYKTQPRPWAKNGKFKGRIVAEPVYVWEKSSCSDSGGSDSSSSGSCSIPHYK